MTPVNHPPSVKAYIDRIGAEVLNFRRAMVKIHKGQYYIERALIRISEDGSVTSSAKEFAPTEEEAKAMKEELLKVPFPKSVRAVSIDGLLPKLRGSYHVFYHRPSGEIIMVQERVETEKGKKFISWTMMDNGSWEALEPDGKLPFWKPKVGRGHGTAIMIHEGAKAAQAAASVPDDHPWAEELRKYEHWGMIGGALAPHRTDYEELGREAPSRVVYVCDNDHPGKSALEKVSKAWGKSLYGVIFGDKFPVSWDMADPLPATLYSRSGRWIGPSLSSLLCPATFATELVPTGEKGRPAAVIRAEFAEEWMHCVTPEAFVHRDWTHKVLMAAEFNSMVAPFSNVDDTARLLRKDFSSKAAVLKYVPGEPSGIFSGGTSGTYINTFHASEIKPEPGDAGPWIDFMENLIPDPGDREELYRWVATLVARPDIRMLYGVLLISEMQGVGKGTLGEKILAPLVGEVNVSYPSEQEIVESNFNYWLAHKRLAVVHEIYAGHSSKAYNKLKSAITDRYVTVQKKYQANYEVESWIHIFACSNSLRAMKLSMDDRRWFVPKVSEVKRSDAYWDSFNAWLDQDGGLARIAAWARDYVAEHGPVAKGSPAPWSALKREIVEEGYSPGQMIVSRALDRIGDLIEEGALPRDCYVLDLDLVALIRNELYEGRHNDHLERPLTVRNVAKAQGWAIGEVASRVKAWGPAATGARVLSLDPRVAAASPADLKGRPLDLAALSAL